MNESFLETCLSEVTHSSLGLESWPLATLLKSLLTSQIISFHSLTLAPLPDPKTAPKKMEVGRPTFIINKLAPFGLVIIEEGSGFILKS